MSNIVNAPLFILCLKNAPTSARYSLDKHELILIILGRQYQYTFRNDMYIQLYLSLHFYLLYLLLNSCDGNDAKSLRNALRCRPTFSKSLMVSVRWSSGCTELFFVELWVKVDGKYYREVRLKKQVLPVMRHIAGNTFLFQQDSAPVIVVIICCCLPNFIKIGSRVRPPDAITAECTMYCC